MAEETVTRKLAAILSADVVGYSRLMQANEAATVETLKQYRAVIRRLVDRHAGRVVNTPGDALLAVFPSAVEAVRCAVEVQKAIDGRNLELDPDRRMEFRIGVNLGDVIEEQEDGTVYGDGVNIAARMEALADTGGICVSSTVYDAVESKLECGFDFLGEQQVKNISKPVRVYRVRSEVARRVQEAAPKTHRLLIPAVAAAAVLVVLVGGIAVWRYTEPPASETTETTAPEQRTPGIPDEPSIAVLPFDNMSGEAEQEYFADGITESIINGLSRFPKLKVIARSSSFTYKNQQVRVDQVGQELGVRYVMEGSVQRVGDQVRITAQLIDARTNAHVWAGHYDRELADIFALQDEVTGQIVAALELELGPAENGEPGPAEEKVGPTPTSPPTPTSSVDAYDLYLRATASLEQRTPDANREAERLLEQAKELDPKYTKAYVALGQVYLQRWSLEWDRDPAILDRARQLAETARYLDPWQAPVYSVLGQVHLWRKDHDNAVAFAERALELDPSSADVHAELAEILNFSGRPADAIEVMEEAMRLNPRPPASYLSTLGQAYMLTGQFDQAVLTLEEAVAADPELVSARALLAIVYTELERDDAARRAYDEMQRLRPNFTSDSLEAVLPYKDAAPLERIVDGLGAIGMIVTD